MYVICLSNAIYVTWLKILHVFKKKLILNTLQINISQTNFDIEFEFQRGCPQD